MDTITIEYDVVQAGSRTELVRMVNVKLRAGWKPGGSVAYGHDAAGLSVYIQGITKLTKTLDVNQWDGR